MNKITKEEFVQFLKDNNVHPFTFVRRWHESGYTWSTGNKFSEYFKKAAIHPRLISGSFNWKRTPEGHAFWEDMYWKFKAAFKHLYNE